jgi:hypothetical protein
VPAAAPEITLSEVRSQICADLLSCLKSLGLYPKDHPRVRAALHSIRQGLDQLDADSDEAFVLATDRSSAVEPKGEGSGATRAEMDLIQLLRTNLVQRLRVRPGVTDEELYQFCLFLQDESPSLSRLAEDTAPDPASWTHLEVTFFRLSDTTVAAAAEDGVSSGTHWACGGPPVVAEFLAGLSEAHRGLIGGLLRDGAVQEKLTGMCSSLLGAPEFGPGGEEDKLNVLVEVLKEILPELSRCGAHAEAREAMLATLGRLTHFVDANRDNLGGSLNRYGVDDDTRQLGHHVAETIASDAEIVDRIAVLERAKRQLSSLFRTVSVRDGVQSPPQEVPGVASGPGRPEAARSDESSKTSDCALAAAMQGATYDPADMESKLRDTDLDRPYLQALLEILALGQVTVTLREQWKLLKARVLEAAENPSFLHFALKAAAPFIESAGSNEVSDLIGALLEKVDWEQGDSGILERLAVYPGAVDAVRRFLDRVFEQDRERAVRCLASVDGRGNEALQVLVREKLVALSEYPALFAQWMEEKPQSLLKSDVLEALMERLGRKGIHRAYKKYFSSVGPSQAEAVLRQVPSGLPAAEQVVFAAMDCGASAVRNLAIVQLPRFPGRIAIETLKEIVRLNNYLPQPRIEEVRAALEALAGMKHPAARSFFNRVVNRRKWVRHEFRKEIRREVAELLKEAADPHDDHA